jgi:glycine/D-amino acid oxidase-like deaminating enzyme
MRSNADIVICGAGITGIAAAYHLAVRHGRRVLLVDERQPLTLTSDKGTQGYRNWWPGPDDTMLRLISRSIDLMEETARESGNAFRLNRRGYLFATANEAQATEMEATARQVSGYGMGPLRLHPGSEPYRPAPAEGFEDQPVGADLLRGDSLRRAFPYLAPETVAALHIRRAGCFNGIAFGQWMLTRALSNGAEFVHDAVVGVDHSGGRVNNVRLASGGVIETSQLVIAAGPALPNVARMLDLELPVVHELHAKVTLRDTRHAVPRHAPFLIWNDPVANRRGGAHLRPVDLTHGDELYLLWTYETDVQPYVWPPTFDAAYARIVLEGTAQIVPALAPYIAQVTRDGAQVDGGYYCKTAENRPLVGPLPVEGAYVLGAVSGSGIMGAHGCAELVAAHVTGATLPDYAKWFLPSRYDDPAYRALIEQWGPLVGQL